MPGESVMNSQKRFVKSRFVCDHSKAIIIEHPESCEIVMTQTHNESDTIIRIMKKKKVFVYLKRKSLIDAPDSS